jgi:hypothetical protein
MFKSMITFVTLLEDVASAVEDAVDPMTRNVIWAGVWGVTFDKVDGPVGDHLNDVVVGPLDGRSGR